MCRNCHDLNRRIKRPGATKLKEQVEAFGRTATGRLYGVSSGAIKKWLIGYRLHGNLVKKKLDFT